MPITKEIKIMRKTLDDIKTSLEWKTRHYEARCIALTEAVRQLQALVAKQEEESNELRSKLQNMIKRYEMPLKNRNTVQLGFPFDNF